jgi:hypothetical protein
MIKRSAKATKADTPPLEITSEQALAFIRKMQKAFPKAPRTKAEKERLQKYLAKFTDRELRAVGTRVQGDLMLRPPVTIAPKRVRKRTMTKRRRAD